MLPRDASPKPDARATQDHDAQRYEAPAFAHPVAPNHATLSHRNLSAAAKRRRGLVKAMTVASLRIRICIGCLLKSSDESATSAVAYLKGNADAGDRLVLLLQSPRRRFAAALNLRTQLIALRVSGFCG